MQPPPDPLAKLTKQYVAKFSKQHQAESRTANKPMTADEYYARLLGVQAATAKRNAGVAHKPAVVQRAYAAAVEHQTLVRTQGMTDAEASRQIDELLEVNERREAEISRMRAQAAKKLRQDFDWGLQELQRPSSAEVQQHKDANLGKDPMMSLLQDYNPDTEPPKVEQSGDQDLEKSLRSIFDANPSALEGMMRWSERLQAGKNGV